MESIDFLLFFACNTLASKSSKGGFMHCCSHVLASARSGMRFYLWTAITSATLFVAPWAWADNGEYCDEVNAVVNCLDPALNPNSAVGGGVIRTDASDITPGVRINIVDDGAFDGIYQCTVAELFQGGVTRPVFATINGHNDTGDMIFMLAALDPTHDAYAGYGKGKFTNITSAGATLSGTTNAGRVFAFDLTLGLNNAGATFATLSGKVRVKGRDTNLLPIEYDLGVKCVSIW